MKVLVVVFSIVVGTLFANEVETGEVSYDRDNPKLKGYLARPAKNGQFPAIIMIHEWWGLNNNIRENARKFAKENYVALAVDLYNGKSTNDPKIAGDLAGNVTKNQSAAFRNLKEAVAYLKKQGFVQKTRLASIGWCFGGGWSYQMAKNSLGVKASVIYYGRFNPKDDLKQMRAKILGNFAEKDRMIRVDSVKEFQATLKNHNKAHEIYIYPNTHHGFANPSNPIFDKKAADLAWKRTLSFIQKHL